MRSGAPVYAADDVLEEAGYIPEVEVEVGQDDDDGADHEEVVEEFRQFIEEINPEDFSS